MEANLFKRGQKGGLAHQRVTQHFDRVIDFLLKEREQHTRQTANELEVLQLPQLLGVALRYYLIEFCGEFRVCFVA